MIWRRPYFGSDEWEYSALGPMEMTTHEAFQTQFQLRAGYLTPHIYRWVWEPGDGWIYMLPSCSTRPMA
jgi:hypothetical protein